MYKIYSKKVVSNDTYIMDVEAPRIASSALPGQFLIVKMTEFSERIPLTISDYDLDKGLVTIVFKAVGKSTIEMGNYNVGDSFLDIVGPLGKPSEFIHLSKKEREKKNYIFIGGGVGIAPIYPQVKYLSKQGIKADVIIGAKTKSLLVFEEELKKVSNLYVTTDDNSYGTKGLVTDKLRELILSGKQYDEIIAIGPLIMMKFVVDVAKEYGIKSTVSLNSLMVDGTGMCGACRVTIGGKTKFTCVDGPEFDGASVDFVEAMKRQAMYNTVEGKHVLDTEELNEGHVCHIGGIIEEERDKRKRVPVRELEPSFRKTNFLEVSCGYNAEEAIIEAQRCLDCKKPLCVSNCPVHIDIPLFIKHIAEGDFNNAAKVLDKDTALPAVCGRVCPQETQCEGACILGKKYEPIAIGKLERFIGDWSRENNIVYDLPKNVNSHKVAIIGSGPAGLSCAKELLLLGYNVTIFEALHEYGGVLVYGIPSFRLPKETVVKHEINNIKKLGAIFERNVVVGRTVSIDDLINKENFDAVFIGTGAGLPNFMNIKGENLCGVVSANEFLTRNNLLFSYKAEYDTPNYVGKRVAVVGGGNVAMDAARTALRLGAEVHVIYRRSEEELPARLEEIHHAKEEGIIFNFLCNPVEIIEDDNAWVKAIKCVRMELGEPDASGRRRPIEIPNSEFIIESDMIIMSIGTSPNPLIASTTDRLEINKWNAIVADENTGATTREGVFAGGDAVSGAATVILAMGAGKKSAKAIDDYIKSKNKL